MQCWSACVHFSHVSVCVCACVCVCLVSHAHSTWQGLAYMLAREQKRDALDHGLLQLHPYWLQLVTKSGYVFYLNR